MSTRGSSDSHPIDKEYLYGRYQGSIDRKEDFHYNAAMKALDMKIPPPNVDARKWTNGLGWKELLVIALLVALPTAGAFVWCNQKQDPSPSPTQPSAPTVDNDTDTGLIGIGKT